MENNEIMEIVAGKKNGFSTGGIVAIVLGAVVTVIGGIVLGKKLNARNKADETVITSEGELVEEETE